MEKAKAERKRSLRFFFIGLVCWNLAVSIDSTALSVALPTISHQLNATTTEAFWCGTAFTLCSAAFQPIYASFSDTFGRKSMLLAALTFFTVGSIICGVAQHIAVLLVGRSIQGAGGGGLLTMTYVLMTDFCSLQERHVAITALSLTWLVGTVVGPIASGSFVQYASWRYLFWLNIPFCLLSYLIIICFIHTPYKRSHSPRTGLRNIDWLGSILFVASITSVLIPLSWGGTMYAWTSWHTTIPLTSGLIGLLAWLTYSLFIPANPMIPLSIMANRTAALHYLGNLVHGIVQFGGLYYLPLYYQTVLEYSPIISGVAMLPQCIIAAPFSALAAITIAKTNSVKPLIVASWICLTGGIPLFTLLEPSTPVIRWVCLNIPSAIGIGSLFGGLALATQAAAETSGSRSTEEVRKIKGMAASLNPFFRTLGQALGIVIAQAAFTNQMGKRAGAEYANDAASLGVVLLRLPADSALGLKLVGDYNESLHTVWWVLSGIAGVMLFLTLFVKDIGPRGENGGFFGFDGSVDANVARKVRIVHPSPRMVAMLRQREDEVMKEAGWGIREVRKSEDSAFQEPMSPRRYDGASPSRYDGVYEPYRHGGDGTVCPPSERLYRCNLQEIGQSYQSAVSATTSPSHQEQESPQRLQHDDNQTLIPQTPTRTARVHLPRWPSPAAETLLYYTPERSPTPRRQEWKTPCSLTRGVPVHDSDYVQTDMRGHKYTESVTSDVLEMMRAEEEEEEQHTPTRRGGRGRVGREVA